MVRALWHGAGLELRGVGGYHGALLAVHRRWRDAGAATGREALPYGTAVAASGSACSTGLHRLGDLPGRVAADITGFFDGAGAAGVVVTPPFVRASSGRRSAFVIHQVLAERAFVRRFLALPPIVQAASYAAVAVLVFLFSP
jgi:hypothetical protein